MFSMAAERAQLVLGWLLLISREEPINAQNRAQLQPATGYRTRGRAATVFPAALEEPGGLAGSRGESVDLNLTIRGQISG